jgi:hypothetical protein
MFISNKYQFLYKNLWWQDMTFCNDCKYSFIYLNLGIWTNFLITYIVQIWIMDHFAIIHMTTNFLYTHTHTHTHTNLLNFMALYKFCMKFSFHRFINHMDFILWLIWTIFLYIQYLLYSSRWNIIFEWHTWIFIFNT